MLETACSKLKHVSNVLEHVNKTYLSKPLFQALSYFKLSDKPTSKCHQT